MFSGAKENTPPLGELGQLLRRYRERCADPTQHKSKKLTQEKLGELLGCSGSMISHWEQGKYPIGRQVLFNLLKVLRRYGGIQTLEDADQLLRAGDCRPLNSEEIEQLWPKGEVGASGKTLSPAPPPIVSFPIAPKALEPPFMAPSLPPQGIFGRDAELQKIFELLRLDAPTEEAPPVALRGMGGVGKTTLAIAVGRTHDISQAFPDGVLWVALGPHATLRPLFEHWGQALGMNLLPERDEAACQSRLRTTLFQRRALLIVDDVWDVKEGQAFGLGGPQCRVLFTTREVPIARELATGARTVRVDILSPEASLSLLKCLAPEAVLADPMGTQQLCKRLEYLPLALTLAGRLLAKEAEVPSRIHRMVDELIERRQARLNLSQSEERLGLPEDEAVSLRAILGLSISRLAPEDRKRFAMLSAFGSEPLTWDLEAAKSVWKCSLEQAEETTLHFIQRGLVERRENRYWLHALLADFADEIRESMKL